MVFFAMSKAVHINCCLSQYACFVVFSPRVIFNACMSWCVLDLIIDIAVVQVQWHSVAQFTLYCTPLEHIQLGWGGGG